MIVFLAALAAFTFGDIFSSKSSPTASPSPLASPLVRVGADQVANFEVIGKTSTLTVTRQGTGWVYALCPAAQPGCPPQPADAVRTVILLDAVIGMRPSAS